jgi:hypothetical protein
MTPSCYDIPQQPPIGRHSGHPVNKRTKTADPIGIASTTDRHRTIQVSSLSLRVIKLPDAGYEPHDSACRKRIVPSRDFVQIAITY